MRLRACTEEEAKSLNIQPYWYGFKIPYFTVAGTERKDKFFRYRLDTARPRTKGWASVAPSPQKYVQPIGSGSAAYFAPTLTGVKWLSLVKSVDQPICITEGELKAACMCRFGVPTIGLGGVYNWRTADMQPKELLPELEEFVWEGRCVVIMYDSDIESKPQVRYAAASLSNVLTARGAIVRLTHPPFNVDTKKKTGVDDWLYDLPEGEDRKDSLLKLVSSAPQVENNAALHALNLEVARVREAKNYVQISTGMRMTARELATETEYGGRTYCTTNYSGEKGKPVSVVKTWLTWGHCRELRSYAYEPGKPLITDDAYYNTWTGLGVKPCKGDIKPFLWLIERLVSDIKARTWFTCWLAAPLQNLGLKLQNGVVLWDLGGTGKTLLADTMEKIYGQANFGRVSSADFGHRFNAGVEGKQFVVGDETSTSEKKRASEAIKKMITSKRVVIEHKGVDVYTVNDHANFLFFTNFPNAYYVADQDRRLFIYQVMAPEMTPKESADYAKWLEGDGPSAALDYLQQLDISSFSAYERPPETTAKLDAIRYSYNDVRLWIEEAKEDPTGFFGEGHYLHTVRQLVSKFKSSNDNVKVTEQWMGVELAHAGCKLAAGGSNNIYIDGKKTRVHIIGAPPELADKYAAMKSTQIRDIVKANEAVKKFENQTTKSVADQLDDAKDQLDEVKKIIEDAAGSSRLPQLAALISAVKKITDGKPAGEANGKTNGKVVYQ